MYYVVEIKTAELQRLKEDLFGSKSSSIMSTEFSGKRNKLQNSTFKNETIR